MTNTLTLEEQIALFSAMGGHDTEIGTAEHGLFERMAERGWVKVVDLSDTRTWWKLSGDGLLHADYFLKRLMVEWSPIYTCHPKSEEESFLVWCPGLRVSGPWVVAYFQNNEWKAAITGTGLSPQPTHWMPLPEPPVRGGE